MPGGARPGGTDRARRRQPRAGVFAKVNQLQPGDLIVVRRANGTQVNFAVTQVAYADKDSFPTQAVYGATDAPELRLITCGGPFDPSNAATPRSGSFLPPRSAVGQL